MGERAPDVSKARPPSERGATKTLGGGLHAKFGLPPPVRLSAQGATDTEWNLKYDTVSYGVTHDNFDTPEDERGIPLLPLPEAKPTVRRVFFSVSQRAAEIGRT